MPKLSFYSCVLTALWIHIPLSFSQTSCATYCSNYDQVLVNCRNLYSSGVDGSGPISTGAVNCMCIGTESFTGYYEMSKCNQCNLLTGNNAIVNLAWVETCYTNQFLGPQAAANCWNDNLVADIQISSIIGPKCYHTEAGSQPSSSIVVASSAVVVPTNSVNSASATSTAAIVTETSVQSPGASSSSVPSSSSKSPTSTEASASVLVVTTTATSPSSAASAPTTKSTGSQHRIGFGSSLVGIGVVALCLFLVL